MYGLINKAIQDMICSKFGPEIWLEVRHKAEVEEQFVNIKSYHDNVTYRLILAASEILGLSDAEVMKAFGEHWVRYTAAEGFSEIIDMCGESLPEFLENLDNLHARVGIVFPKLQPPSFECAEAEENSLHLHYYSSREGLAPMVFGLLEGLGKRFDTKVEVTQIQSREEGHDHDEFAVNYQANRSV
ncbi:heme NO binding domain-containing protein [Calothrix sp. NIES-2100]|uniref:heme NO-binding domain-containing protein n=1 Tax=Calothrix sp. NIES-2100 TaxID=1954172 RepID=UPI000B5DCA64|nr:heme NO binding domain-containing protein [Calothrix sp. NIES-2100]